MNTSFQKTTASDEWATPWEIVNDLGEFDMDVCATPENAKANHFYTIDNDGLKQNWGGGEYGAIRRIVNQRYINFARKWQSTTTASCSSLPGPGIKCGKRSFSQKRLQYSFYGKGSSSFFRMEHQAGVPGVTRRLLHLVLKIYMPC